MHLVLWHHHQYSFNGAGAIGREANPFQAYFKNHLRGSGGATRTHSFDIPNVAVYPIDLHRNIWQERKDSNPNRADLESAVLPLHHVLIWCAKRDLNPHSRKTEGF